MQYDVSLPRPYQTINNYGYGAYGAESKLPKPPDNIMGIKTKDLAQYKVLAEEFAPTVAKLIAGMSPIEQYAQLEARIKVMNRSPWLRVPIIGSFLQSRLAEYKARLIALEEEIEDYRKIKRRKLIMWTMLALSAGTLVAFGVTGVIRNIVKTVE